MSNSTSLEPIPFIDLQAQRRHLGDRVGIAIQRVLEHGRYLLGPEVEELEQQLARHTGARHCITCANGTDAIVLALNAMELGPGEAVIVPSFTFCASAEAVVLAGGIPVFADVHATTFNIDADSAAQAFEAAAKAGLTVRGIEGVGLFGQSADYAPIGALAADRGVWVVDDAAQSFGARTPAGNVGTLAAITTTSFYPAKPLGCYGDGGAIFTDDAAVDARLRSLRMHGQGSHQYDNVRIGHNSRLDTLQAAILIEKLAIFDEELVKRQAIADRYSAALQDVVVVPRMQEGFTSSWAQYTVLAEPGRRAAIRAYLGERGVPTAVYYPKPLHRQMAYRDYPAADDLAVSDDLADRAFSLPMHPYLEHGTQDRIIEAVRGAIAEA